MSNERELNGIKGEIGCCAIVLVFIAMAAIQSCIHIQEIAEKLGK